MNDHADVQHLAGALAFEKRAGLPICVLSEFAISGHPRIAEDHRDFIRYVLAALAASLTSTIRLIPVERADASYRHPEVDDFD